MTEKPSDAERFLCPNCNTKSAILLPPGEEYFCGKCAHEWPVDGPEEKPTDEQLTKFAAEEVLGWAIQGDDWWKVGGEFQRTIREFNPLTDERDDAEVRKAMADRQDAGEVDLWVQFQVGLRNLILSRPTEKYTGTIWDLLGHYETGDYTRAAWAVFEAMKATG